MLAVQARVQLKIFSLQAMLVHFIVKGFSGHSQSQIGFLDASVCPCQLLSDQIFLERVYFFSQVLFGTAHPFFVTN